MLGIVHAAIFFSMKMICEGEQESDNLLPNWWMVLMDKSKIWVSVQTFLKDEPLV